MSFYYDVDNKRSYIIVVDKNKKKTFLNDIKCYSNVNIVHSNSNGNFIFYYLNLPELSSDKLKDLTDKLDTLQEKVLH